MFEVHDMNAEYRDGFLHVTAPELLLDLVLYVGKVVKII
jgi:hypothetical protein